MIFLVVATTIFFELPIMVAGQDAALKRLAIASRSCGYLASDLTPGSFNGQRVLVLGKKRPKPGVRECAWRWIKSHPKSRLKIISGEPHG
jgi:hypothetical protein